MAGFFSVKITGAKELEKALLGLEKKVARKAVRNAVKAGASIILEETEAQAPVGSGELRDAITIKTRTRKGTLYANVQVGEKDFTGDTFYAAFVEYGTEKMEPNPFMQRAFEAKKQEAAKEMEQILVNGIEEAVKSSRKN